MHIVFFHVQLGQRTADVRVLRRPGQGRRLHRLEGAQAGPEQRQRGLRLQRRERQRERSQSPR